MKKLFSAVLLIFSTAALAIPVAPAAQKIATPSLTAVILAADVYGCPPAGTSYSELLSAIINLLPDEPTAIAALDSVYFCKLE